MMLLKPHIFLTFVLACVVTYVSANAAPRSKQTQTLTITPPEDSNKPPVDMDKENLSPTLVPMKPSDKNISKFYPFIQSLSPHVGLAQDFKNSKSLSVFGIHYMFPKYRSPQWEITADLLTNSEGHFALTRRKIFNERTYFRPYYRYGIALRLIGSDGFATLFRLNNYLVVGGVGLESFFRSPLSWRVGLEASAGAETAIVQLNLGYSWGW